MYYLVERLYKYMVDRLHKYLQASLGSSDDMILWSPTATSGLSGHVWVNPVDTNSFMALVW